jgi:hypothetical protein
MYPHHLPFPQVPRAMPRSQLNALVVILERVLHDAEQRVGLVLVDAHVVAHGEDDLAEFLFGPVFVVLLVLVQGDGDVDAGFGGPGLGWMLVRSLLRRVCGLDCKETE